MVTQAFIDESFDENATFVFGGYIANADTWAKFAKDWDQLLPRFGVLGSDNHYRFKMAEMAQPGRIQNVLPFYRVIERYDLFALSCKIDISDLRRAQDRISIEGQPIDWGYTTNPYSMGFRCLMDKFHNNRDKVEMVFPRGDKIDFIFDKRGEQRMILAAWDDYIRNRSDEARENYGAYPRFEDDLEFLPLQAADFWAWWVRKWYADGTPEKVKTRDFGVWKASVPPKGATISFTEDDLAKTFVSYIREHIDRPVYDAKYFPRPGSLS